MKLRLKIWRQSHAEAKGAFQTYTLSNIPFHVSFLEMLDQLNETLIAENQDPVAFDHDCREGICGACSLMINGQAHGPNKATAACQLHMRSFKDGDNICVEPWRARAFGVVKDLVCNRHCLDRIMQSGGFITAKIGSAPEANNLLIPKENADKAMDAAACIGCGACVAACPNGSAMLFTAAKISHLRYLPQGQGERTKRVVAMVKAMDDFGFGSCTNVGECEAACPKEIKLDVISQMNRDYAQSRLKHFF